MYKFLRKKFERCIEHKNDACMDALWHAKEAIGCALWATAISEREYAVRAYVALDDTLNGYEPEVKA